MKIDCSLLSASDYGVPQSRKRFIFVGIRDHEFDFNGIIKTHGPGTSKKFVNVKRCNW